MGGDEIMKLGTKSICAACGKPIEWIGPYWRHIGPQPRHIATPKPKEAKEKSNADE
jgi:hypothetical protein